jgi:hypothetical protein
MPPIHPGDDRDDDSDLAALQVSTSVDGQESDVDALTVLGQPDLSPAGDTDVWPPVIQVTNPTGTISVTAYLTGSIAGVELSPGVTRLTESELGAAIAELADVAALRATAVLHVVVVQMFVAQGFDLDVARDFVGSHLPFATPAQADSALEALSARYAQQVS